METNIKEISIKTHQALVLYTKDQYSDLLRISKNKISFKRKYDKDFINGEPLDWSIVSYDKKFENKVKKVFSLINEKIKSDMLCVFDCDMFTIKITYDDYTYKTYSLSSDFYTCRLPEIADEIKSLIPSYCTYSDALGVDYLDRMDFDILDRLLSFFEEVEKDGKGYVGYPGFVCDLEYLLDCAGCVDLDSVSKEVEEYMLAPDFEKLSLEEIAIYFAFIKSEQSMDPSSMFIYIKDYIKIIKRIKTLYEQQNK